MTFRWLAIVVMLLLVGHIALDATARFRRRKASSSQSAASDAWVQRFNGQFRAQHLLLMLSVTASCLSGIFLFGTRYPGAHWAATLSGALERQDFPRSNPFEGPARPPPALL